jgi:hypothetical protein
MAWGAGATNEHCLSRAPDDKAMDPAARSCLGRGNQPRVALRCALLAGRFRLTTDYDHLPQLQATEQSRLHSQGSWLPANGSRARA